MNAIANTSDDLSSKFRWPDYLVFALVLVVSAGIGVFYAFFQKKQKTTEELLMAGRSMGTFPMAMSLIASFLSAISILGNPAEVSVYGTQYSFNVISSIFVFLSASYLYLPVFYKLENTSAYEYLEHRFSYSVRVLGGLTFSIQMCIYMAIVVYAPALAMSQVTGINTYVAVSGLFLVCIFYTAFGGMKAVMWTDTFQVAIMFLAVITVVMMGAFKVSDETPIWRTADEGKRLEWWNFNMDPRDRHTVWGVTIGYYFMWIAIYGVNQSQVQRYLTVPTMRQAQLAIWLNGFGIIVMMLLNCLLGLIMYAKYHRCDPLADGTISTTDQLLPVFVMETLSDIPGFAGLFVAGVFSGALSTVSSGLNSMAAIATEDIIKKKWTTLDDEKLARITKVLALGFGIVCYGLVFVVEQLGGSVLTAALSIFGMVGGPLLGVFTLGIFFPWANARGAFLATIIALIFTMWMGFGAQVAISNKSLVIPKLPWSVAGCAGNVTAPTNQGDSGGILEFYRVSYIWYSMIGTTTVIILGLVISFITGCQDPRKLNPDLISEPIDKLLSWLLPKKIREMINWQIGTEWISPDSQARKPTRNTAKVRTTTNLFRTADGLEDQHFD